MCKVNVDDADVSVTNIISVTKSTSSGGGFEASSPYCHT